jgi:hypothetical protein
MIRRESGNMSPCMMRMCPRIAITQNLTSSHRLEHSDHIRIEVRRQVMRLSMRISGRMNSRSSVRREGIRMSGIVAIDETWRNFEVVRVGGWMVVVGIENKRLQLLKLLAS